MGWRFADTSSCTPCARRPTRERRPRLTSTSLASVKIQTSAKRPPVIAKTAGQLEYLRNIASHDVVFGVGPAGTGKTYLAMSSALAGAPQGRGRADHPDPPGSGSR